MTFREDRNLVRCITDPAVEFLRFAGTEGTGYADQLAQLEVLYSTGVRGTELIRLRLTDIDVERASVFVHEGKGRRDRVVPIGERALAWVDRYLI